MRKILGFQHLLIIVALLCSQKGFGADNLKDWMYPGLQRGGTSSNLTDNGRPFGRTFQYVTEDPFAKVILWYAEKHGVKKDHEIFEKLKESDLQNLKPFQGTITHSSVGGERITASAFIYDIAPDRAHVTMVKEDPENGQTIIVSIAGDGSKTTVQFVQRLTNP